MRVGLALDLAMWRPHAAGRPRMQETLRCDWRRPDWDEWALYIEQEARGTTLVRPPLAFSIARSLFCSRSPAFKHIQLDTGAMFVSPQHHFIHDTLSCHLLVQIALTRRLLCDLEDLKCKYQVCGSSLHATLVKSSRCLIVVEVLYIKV